MDDNSMKKSRTGLATYSTSYPRSFDMPQAVRVTDTHSESETGYTLDKRFRQLEERLNNAHEKITTLLKDNAKLKEDVEYLTDVVNKVV